MKRKKSADVVMSAQSDRNSRGSMRGGEDTRPVDSGVERNGGWCEKVLTIKFPLPDSPLSSYSYPPPASLISRAAEQESTG